MVAPPVLDRPGVIVTGMHRSGTSSVARVINLLGFDLGSGELMPALPSNPAGHWEPLAVVQLDDAIVDQLGGDWAAPPPLEAAASMRSLASSPFGSRAREIMTGDFPGSGWVWKDPRAALLLPFWFDIVPAGHTHRARRARPPRGGDQPRAAGRHQPLVLPCPLGTPPAAGALGPGRPAGVGAVLRVPSA